MRETTIIRDPDDEQEQWRAEDLDCEGQRGDFQLRWPLCRAAGQAVCRTAAIKHRLGASASGGRGACLMRIIRSACKPTEHMIRIINLLDAGPLTRDDIQVGIAMLRSGVLSAILARMIDRGLIVCDGDRYKLGTRP
jgi:hypothetical protein